MVPLISMSMIAAVAIMSLQRTGTLPSLSLVSIAGFGDSVLGLSDSIATFADEPGIVFPDPISRGPAAGQIAYRGA